MEFSSIVPDNKTHLVIELLDTINCLKQNNQKLNELNEKVTSFYKQLDEFKIEYGKKTFGTYPTGAPSFFVLNEEMLSEMTEQELRKLTIIASKCLTTFKSKLANVIQTKDVLKNSVKSYLLEQNKKEKNALVKYFPFVAFNLHSCEPHIKLIIPQSQNPKDNLYFYIPEQAFRAIFNQSSFNELTKPTKNEITWVEFDFHREVLRYYNPKAVAFVLAFAIIYDQKKDKARITIMKHLTTKLSEVELLDILKLSLFYQSKILENETCLLIKERISDDLKALHIFSIALQLGFDSFFKAFFQGILSAKWEKPHEIMEGCRFLCKFIENIEKFQNFPLNKKILIKEAFTVLADRVTKLALENHPFALEELEWLCRIFIKVQPEIYYSYNTSFLIYNRLALIFSNQEVKAPEALFFKFLRTNEKVTDPINQNSLTHLFLLVDALSQSCSQPQESFSQITKIVQEQPSNIFALLTRAQLYQSSSQIEEAIQDYITVLKIDPNNTYSLVQLGELYQEQNKLAEALESYHRLYSTEVEKNISCLTDNKFPSLLCLLAETRINLLSLQYKATWEHAIPLKIINPDFLSQMAQYHEELLSQSLLFRQGLAAIWNSQAELLIRLGKFENAIAMFFCSLGYHPTSKKILANLTMLAKNEPQFFMSPDLISIVTNYLKVDNPDINILRFRANLYFAQNKSKEALQDINTVIFLSGDLIIRDDLLTRLLMTEKLIVQNQATLKDKELALQSLKTLASSPSSDSEIDRFEQFLFTASLFSHELDE